MSGKPLRGCDRTAQVLKQLSQSWVPSHYRSLILPPGGFILLVPNEAMLNKQVPVSNLGICQTLMGLVSGYAGDSTAHLPFSWARSDALGVQIA